MNTRLDLIEQKQEEMLKTLNTQYESEWRRHKSRSENYDKIADALDKKIKSYSKIGKVVFAASLAFAVLAILSIWCLNQDTLGVFCLFAFGICLLEVEIACDARDDLIKRKQFLDLESYQFENDGSNAQWTADELEYIRKH